MNDQARYKLTIEDFEGSTGEVIGNNKLYDAFYAKVYDTLVAGKEERIPFEATMVEEYIERYIKDIKSWRLLDIGCGTGDHAAEFAKKGLAKVTALDRSEFMVREAKKKYPELRVSWKAGDATQISTFAAEEFNIATFFYFTIYYFPNLHDLFMNCFMWLSPGSIMVIHAVNRKKFDPILDSASPFPAFSLQKYSKERITKSEVSFDKFDYLANFMLEDENAKFLEEFKFKDGTVRRQEHVLHMVPMEQIIKDAEAAGFKFRDHMDLKQIGYEYQYLLFFIR